MIKVWITSLCSQVTSWNQTNYTIVIVIIFKLLRANGLSVTDYGAGLRFVRRVATLLCPSALVSRLPSTPLTTCPPITPAHGSCELDNWTCFVAGGRGCFRDATKLFWSELRAGNLQQEQRPCVSIVVVARWWLSDKRAEGGVWGQRSWHRGVAHGTQVTSRGWFYGRSGDELLSN